MQTRVLCRAVSLSVMDKAQPLKLCCTSSRVKIPSFNFWL